MRAISLWQPWATLVAIGAKTIETRPRRLSYRGPLAIAATASTPRAPFLAALEVPSIRLALAEHGLDPLNLPSGAIVATCELVDVEPADECRDAILEDYLSRDLPPPRVLAMGDFSKGRFAYLLRNIVRVEPPITAKGKQGLWEFPWPVEVHA